MPSATSSEKVNSISSEAEALAAPSVGLEFNKIGGALSVTCSIPSTTGFPALSSQSPAIPSMLVDPAAVFSPTRWSRGEIPVTETTANVPSVSVIDGVALVVTTVDPSGSRRVPKSANTGAAPSSVSMFSLKVMSIRSMKPLSSVSKISRSTTIGFALSVYVAATSPSAISVAVPSARIVLVPASS